METRKEKFLGLLREVLTAGGALAFGALSGLPAVVGLMVAVAAVGWALAHHEGRAVLRSSIRKTLSALPGVLLAFDLIGSDQAAQLAAFLAPAFALGWSYFEKGGKLPGTVDCLLALLGLMALMMTSCAMAKRVATPGNVGRALVIIDEARRIVESAREPQEMPQITVEK